jgi:glycosyltransferase involved in cell wall biosynthesis
LREHGHEVLLVSPPGTYGEKLQRLGFHWQAAPMMRQSLNPLRELHLLLWLRRLFIRERIDLVHGFTIKCAVYGGLAGMLSGVPARVGAVAGMGYVFTSRQVKARVLRPVIRALLRLALDNSRTRLILQNPDDVELFTAARLVTPERVRLIRGSGVDCTRFHPPPQKPETQTGRFRVLLAARLLWDKGIAEYVAAARELHRKNVCIDFLLAGTPDAGNPAAVPEETVREWVQEGAIQWLGQVDDMPRLFQSVDAVVLPSYREGLPKGLIEAAACGLPLITTDVPGCREVVTDEVDGLLIRPRDAAQLVAAIERLQGDRALRERLGAAARSKTLVEFDEQLVLSRTMDVYRELLEQRAE